MIQTKISKFNLFYSLRRFSGSVPLPHVPRPKIKVCFIADAAHIDKCKQLGIDYIDADSLKKKCDPTDKKGKELKKWSRKYRIFFVSETLVRQLPKLGGPLLTKWGKFPTVVTTLDDISKKVEDGNKLFSFISITTTLSLSI